MGGLDYQKGGRHTLTDQSATERAEGVQARSGQRYEA